MGFWHCSNVHIFPVTYLIILIQYNFYCASNNILNMSCWSENIRNSKFLQTRSASQQLLQKPKESQNDKKKVPLPKMMRVNIKQFFEKQSEIKEKNKQTEQLLESRKKQHENQKQNISNEAKQNCSKIEFNTNKISNSEKLIQQLTKQLKQFSNLKLDQLDRIKKANIQQQLTNEIQNMKTYEVLLRYQIQKQSQLVKKMKNLANTNLVKVDIKLVEKAQPDWGRKIQQKQKRINRFKLLLHTIQIKIKELQTRKALLNQILDNQSVSEANQQGSQKLSSHSSSHSSGYKNRQKMTKLLTLQLLDKKGSRKQKSSLLNSFRLSKNNQLLNEQIKRTQEQLEAYHELVSKSLKQLKELYEDLEIYQFLSQCRLELKQ